MKKTSFLDNISQETLNLINSKNLELEKLKKIINESENEILNLKNELNEEQNKLENLINNDKNIEIISNFEEDEIEQQQLTEKLDLEFENTKNQYNKILQDLEIYSENHIKNILFEKELELEKTKEKLNFSKKKLIKSQSKLSKNQNFSNKYSTNDSLEKIQYLESKISEICILSKSEINEIKSRIDEIISTIEIRKKEINNNNLKFENEIKDRESKYKIHLNVLNDQHKVEKERYQIMLNSLEIKINSLNKIIKETHSINNYNSQLINKDYEKIKNNIYLTNLNLNNKFQTNYQFEFESKEIEEEIELIKKEINEFEIENKNLKKKINKLDKKYYGILNNI